MRSFAPDIDDVSSAKSDVPYHMAIIMDGNNRWARKRGLPGKEGHRAGEEAVQKIIRHGARRGIKVMTLFAFSSENWRRPEQEVNDLMVLFLQALSQRVDELEENNVCLRFIGDRTAFSDELQKGMKDAEAQTATNNLMTLLVAINYGGQWDILQAARQLAEEISAGKLAANELDGNRFQSRLATSDFPPPDLLIRTGGECRLSNFMLWQAAYSELYFSSELWPDFDALALDRALSDYAQRQRRFGRSAEQVQQEASKPEAEN